MKFHDTSLWQGRTYKQIKSDYKVMFWSLMLFLIVILAAIILT